MKPYVLIISGVVALSLTAAVALAHPGLHHDIERVTKALELEPLRADLWIERAHYYRLDEQYDNALSDLERAEELAPDKLDAAAHRGMVYVAMQRDADAERELTRFLEGGPGSSDTFAARARIRVRDGRLALALADYDAALALEADVEYFLDRGRVQVQMGQLDEAASGYRVALSQVGGAVTVLQALIDVEVRRTDYAAALSLVDTAMAASPVKTTWLLRRAEVLRAAGREAEARQALDTALIEADRVLGRRATAIHLLSRARVHLAMGNKQPAQEDALLAINKSPRYGAAREFLDTVNSSDETIDTGR